VIAFSLLLLLHIVLLQIEVGPIADFLFANFGWIPLRSSSLDDLQNWAGAGTFKPSTPIMKPAPKRLRTLLIAKPTLPPTGTFACQE